MSHTFDPYRKWLGIPPEEQPPHHYRLLGIAAFEDDPDVIAYAADRQMSHVRKFQSGRQSQISQKLLNELAQARVCLLDRQRKATYDEQLRGELGVAGNGRTAPAAAPRPSKTIPVPSAPPGAYRPLTPPQPVPPQPSPPQSAPPQTILPEPAPPPSAVLVASGEPPPAMGGTAVAETADREESMGVRTRPVASAARRARRQSAPVGLIMGLCAIGGLLMAALTVIAVSNNAGDESEDTSAAATQDVAAYNPAAADTQRDKPKSRPPKERPRPDRPKREKPLKPSGDDSGSPPIVPPNDEPPIPSVDDPQRTANFEDAIASVEKSLAGRDIAQAATHLHTAQRLQYGAAEKQQVAALSELVDHQQSLWQGVDRALKRLQPGDTITFEDTVVNVEALDGDSITLLDTGNRVTAKVRQLEVRYVAALALRGLNKSDPQAKLALAAFFALDDRSPSPAQLEQARKLLEEAAANGGKSAALAARLNPEEVAPALPQPGEDQTQQDDGDASPDNDAQPPAPAENDSPTVDPADEADAPAAPPVADEPAFPKPGEDVPS